MDHHSNVLEVQRDVDEHSAIRTLIKLDPTTPPEVIKDTWDRLKTQEYMFDDIGKANGPELWLRQIYDPMSECYLYPDKGYVVLANIMAPVNANIHFSTFVDVDMLTLMQARHEILDRAFKEIKLTRLTAMIPTPNKAAIRFATLSRFRFEGALKKAWLKNGQYSDIQLYGLLRDDYLRREVTN